MSPDDVVLSAELSAEIESALDHALYVFGCFDDISDEEVNQLADALAKLRKASA